MNFFLYENKKLERWGLLEMEDQYLKGLKEFLLKQKTAGAE